MSLQTLLDLSLDHDIKKTGLSEPRLRAAVPVGRRYVAFWREYPDILVDQLVEWGGGGNDLLHLYLYQRVFLRAGMRHKYMFATFPRAYSKSFLSVLILMLRCVLYPNAKLFVTTGGKEQASGITREKVDELCKLVPGLKNEIDWRQGKGTTQSKDSVTYKFKNNSVLDIMAARQSSRGKRKTGGLVEEAILIDGQLLNEVIIPTMNVNRLLPDGTRHEEELINKSQLYVNFFGQNVTKLCA